LGLRSHIYYVTLGPSRLSQSHHHLSPSPPITDTTSLWIQQHSQHLHQINYTPNNGAQDPPDKRYQSDQIAYA